MDIFIIAELGINHNGDISIAKKLIDLVKSSGCDAVKFQKRTVNKVYTEGFLNSFRKSPWGFTQRDQKEGLEFGKEEYDKIDRYCKEQDVEWFASAWDIESQEFLSCYNLKYNKVASAMIVDKILLEKIAQEGKYTFISTGMSSLDDIDNVVEIFRKENCPFELMHCVSTYPMLDKNANLRCIDTLRERYKCKVGYSGHEAGLAVSYAAVVFGISSLERHITLDRTMYGSDQAASIEPFGFRQLVGAVRLIPSSLGDGKKRITEDEKKVAKKLREHIYRR